MNLSLQERFSRLTAGNSPPAKIYLVFDSKGANDEARWIQNSLASVFGRNDEVIYADLNSSEDLANRAEIISACRLVAVLETEQTMQSSTCLIEIYAALKHAKPVLRVSIEGRRLRNPLATSTDIVSALENADPRVSNLLEQLGTDATRLAAQMQTAYANIDSLPFNMQAGERVQTAMVEDIAERILVLLGEDRRTSADGAVIPTAEIAAIPTAEVASDSRAIAESYEIASSGRTVRHTTPSRKELAVAVEYDPETVSLKPAAHDQKRGSLCVVSRFCILVAILIIGAAGGAAGIGIAATSAQNYGNSTTLTATDSTPTNLPTKLPTTLRPSGSPSRSPTPPTYSPSRSPSRAPTTSRPTQAPSRSPTIITTASISLAESYSCMVQTNGRVKCWGRLPTTSSSDPVGTFIPDLPNAKKVAAGYNHACAVTSIGLVRCWGSAVKYTLGNNENSGVRTIPVTVQGQIGAATDVASGKDFSCAIVTNGNVQCWGDNVDSIRGDYTTATVPYAGPAVIGITGAIAISCGYSHVCVIVAGGAVKCWGDNSMYQLGTDAGSHPSPFTAIASGVISISCGYLATCAVLDDGSVKCWGNNFYGQLGDGTTNNNKHFPTNMTGISTAKDVKVGGFMSCVLLISGTVQCVGNNDSGTLGDGTRVTQLTPVTSVSGITDAVAIAVSNLAHGCALLASNTVRCWGANYAGQCGDGSSFSDRLTPVTAAGT